MQDETKKKVRAKVFGIFSHYSAKEVARAVASNSGSPLCLYGQALARLGVKP